MIKIKDYHGLSQGEGGLMKGYDLTVRHINPANIVSVTPRYAYLITGYKKVVSAGFFSKTVKEEPIEDYFDMYVITMINDEVYCVLADEFDLEGVK